MSATGTVHGARATALALCRDNGLKTRIFGMGEEGNVTRALMGEQIGTLVTTQD